MHLKEIHFSSCQYSMRAFCSVWANEKLLKLKDFDPIEFDVTIADAGFLCLGGTEFYTGFIQPTAALHVASKMLHTACVNCKKLRGNFRRAHRCLNETVENTFLQISATLS